MDGVFLLLEPKQEITIDEKCWEDGGRGAKIMGRSTFFGQYGAMRVFPQFEWTTFRLVATFI